MIPSTKYSVLVQFCVNGLVLNSLRYKIQKKSRGVCRKSVDYFVVVCITRERNLFPPLLKLHTIAKHQLFGMGIEVGLVGEAGDVIFVGVTFDQRYGFI